MKKETLLIVVVTLVAGLIIGLVVGKKTTGPAVPAPSSAPPGQAPVVNTQQKINELKNIVAADPGNFQAWTTLGNEYFDSNQYMDAIEAYDKALEIKPNSPDVLTDQGVMFKRLVISFDRIHKLVAVKVLVTECSPCLEIARVCRNDIF